MLDIMRRAYQEKGRADGTDYVGPDAGGVHHSHCQGQLVLEQGADRRLKKDLEMPLHRQLAILQDHLA